MPWLLYPQEKGSSYSLDKRGWVDPGTSLYTEQKTCSLGIEPRFLDHPAYTIVTTPNELNPNTVKL
jgi:hypothetical protein